MACPACSSPTIAVSIPEEHREYAPEESATVNCCTRCLTLAAAADERRVDSNSSAAFGRISDAVPTNPAAAVPLLLAVDRCSSLATHREAIADLLEAVERAGADPLLAFDRLAADPELEPAVDLERRRHQLEQLLY